MPWHIEKREDEFCVIKDDDDENEGCHDSREKAERQMRALYASENRTEIRAPVETREAKLTDVNVEKREIEVVTIPYNREAVVEYRGELWHELVEPGAFEGIQSRPNRIKAVRDHDKTRLVGRAISHDTGREDGLVSVTKIAKTELGDETLELARDDMLDVSAGFAVPGSGQVLERSTQKRRIHRAYLDHIAFVADGAYEDARILSVRKDHERKASDLPKLDTPYLDEVLAWLESRR